MLLYMLRRVETAGAGSRDTIQYEKGQIFEVPDRLAKGMLRRGAARPPMREEIEAIFAKQVRGAVEQAVLAAELAKLPPTPPTPPPPQIEMPPSIPIPGIDAAPPSPSPEADAGDSEEAPGAVEDVSLPTPVAAPRVIPDGAAPSAQDVKASVPPPSDPTPSPTSKPRRKRSFKAGPAPKTA